MAMVAATLNAPAATATSVAANAAFGGPLQAAAPPALPCLQLSPPAAAAPAAPSRGGAAPQVPQAAAAAYPHMAAAQGTAAHRPAGAPPGVSPQVVKEAMAAAKNRPTAGSIAQARTVGTPQARSPQRPGPPSDALQGAWQGIAPQVAGAASRVQIPSSSVFKPLASPAAAPAPSLFQQFPSGFPNVLQAMPISAADAAAYFSSRGGAVAGPPGQPSGYNSAVMGRAAARKATQKISAQISGEGAAGGAMLRAGSGAVQRERSTGGAAARRPHSGPRTQEQLMLDLMAMVGGGRMFQKDVLAAEGNIAATFAALKRCVLLCLLPTARMHAAAWFG